MSPKLDARSRDEVEQIPTGGRLIVPIFPVEDQQLATVGADIPRRKIAVPEAARHLANAFEMSGGAVDHVRVVFEAGRETVGQTIVFCGLSSSNSKQFREEVQMPL